MKTRKQQIKESRENQFKSRDEESTIHHSTEWQEESDKYNMNYEDALSIPLHIIPKDKVYAWVRETYMGHTDQRRIPTLRRGGWTPVPASRHPELCYHQHNESGFKDGYITFSGLVLYELPKHIFEKRRKQQEQANLQQVCGLAGTENFMGEPGIPAHVIGNDTSVSRAASFR